MDDLKPCPFCGAGETRMEEQNHWTGLSNVVYAVTLRHFCVRDGRADMITITRKTTDESRTAWNTRTHDGGDDA